jgi:NTP pyrophosphatase (non-canonical NTP hydrolase)
MASLKQLNKRITTMKDAQKLLKFFAQRNNWKDFPNVDKFDHLHEELIEMSQHLRYKSEEERKKFVKENKEIFIDGIGDLFFGMCRLANQLEVDIEDAFNLVKKEIFAKYNHKNLENKLTKNKNKDSALRIY